MLTPSIFGRSFIDDFMDFPFSSTVRNSYDTQRNNLMKTDIKEKDGGYELMVDLPGINKEDIELDLENGYLTIQASKNVNNEEKDDDGKYIRRERFSGTTSRSFYVGNKLTEDDIKAKYEDGILYLDVPKEETKVIESKKKIAIAG